MQKYSVAGNIIDIAGRRVYKGKVEVENGRVAAVVPVATQVPGRYIMPGFVDAHVHIESSMLVPHVFGGMAVKHGTVATVSDPHEIANVCGVAGVDFMLESAALTPLKINFGAPSCVPATNFETAGASIDDKAVSALLARPEIKYLTEMMNFPGVLHHDAQVMAKIAAAKALNKPIDGHAPGLRGADALRYAAAGISTDHECTTLEEAVDKLEAGMYILIREGSAAKNFEALAPLFASHPGKLMLCSDDKHPDELVKGHVNQLVERALAKGYDVYDVLHAACVLPVTHYGLDVGLLRAGDPADFIIVDSLEHVVPSAVFIDGIDVLNAAAEGRQQCVQPVNNFAITAPHISAYEIKPPRDADKVQVRAIKALDGQLLTEAFDAELPVTGGKVMTDIENDLLKIGVVNRYRQAAVSIGFVHGFGLRSGAMASSVAHDSHNIVFVGVDDDAIATAVAAIVNQKGGICVTADGNTMLMPLPVAGLMSEEDGITVAATYEKLDAFAKQLGSKLEAPFMTLSFMALPVIPTLKITDKGLFDVNQFAFTDLFR
ncbi:MAG: adenine deaminase [Edaphocola sp.]